MFLCAKKRAGTQIAHCEFVERQLQNIKVQAQRRLQLVFVPSAIYMIKCEGGHRKIELVEFLCVCLGSKREIIVYNGYYIKQNRTYFGVL